MDSNLQTLPPEVQEYSYYHNQKRYLLSNIRELNRKLKVLDAKICARLHQENKKAYEIIPNENEEKKFGSLGVLKLESKTHFDRISKDNLINLLQRFYQLLHPEYTELNAFQVALGVGEWIWKNRNQTEVFTLRRVYNDTFDAKETSKRKRFCQQHPIAKKAKKQKVLNKNMPYPATKEEFLKYADIPNKPVDYNNMNNNNMQD